MSRKFCPNVFNFSVRISAAWMTNWRQYRYYDPFKGLHNDTKFTTAYCGSSAQSSGSYITPMIIAWQSLTVSSVTMRLPIVSTRRIALRYTEKEESLKLPPLSLKSSGPCKSIRTHVEATLIVDNSHVTHAYISKSKCMDAIQVHNLAFSLCWSKITTCVKISGCTLAA